MPYGIPLSIDSNMNPSRGDPGYLTNATGRSSEQDYLGQKQRVFCDAQIRRLWFITKRRVAMTIRFSQYVSGGLDPKVSGWFYTMNVQFNGDGIQRFTRSQSANAGGGGDHGTNPSQSFTLIADNPTDITSIRVALNVYGWLSGNQRAANVFHIINITPSYISSNNTNIIANTTSSQTTTLTTSAQYSHNTDSITENVFNYKYVLLPDTPNTNQIMNIKTQGMAMYFCTTDGKTLDRAAYQLTISGIDNAGATISNQIVNGFIMHPWGAMTLSYSTIGSSNFSWLLFSYYNGDPVQGINCDRGTGNGTFFDFNTTSNASIVEATIGFGPNNKTLRLPNPATAGQLLTIIYRLSGNGTPSQYLHVDPNGSNLDGSTQTIYIRPSGGNQSAAVRLVSANSAWYLLDVFNCLNWNVMNVQTGQTNRNVSTTAGIVCITSAPSSGSHQTVNLEFSTTSTTGQIHYIKDTLTTSYSSSLVINSSNGGICGLSDRLSGYNASARNRTAVIVATIEGRHYPVGFYQGQ